MRARKRFGQHFLTDEAVLEQIAQASGVGPDDWVMEIGPGYGALTDYLHDIPQRYVAVELDRDLIDPLQAKYPGMELINQDILALELDATLLPGRWKVLGNLPYNISSPLIIKFANWVGSNPGHISDLHFMLQKEMAQRLAAVPDTKAWGRLSIVTQLKFDVSLLFDVGPESFSPPPKVNSSVVRLLPKRDPVECDETVLDQVVRAAFSARRKRLANALKHFDLDWDQLSLDPNMRADNVTLDQFIELSQAFSSHSNE